MEEDKYAKILAKKQVCAILLMRDIRKWRRHVGVQGHKYGLRKPIETSVFEFSYKCVNSSLEKLIKIKVI